MKHAITVSGMCLSLGLLPLSVFAQGFGMQAPPPVKASDFMTTPPGAVAPAAGGKGGEAHAQPQLMAPPPGSSMQGPMGPQMLGANRPVVDVAQLLNGDTNGDGIIDANEMALAVDARLKLMEESMTAAGKAPGAPGVARLPYGYIYDKDKDGKLSDAEKTVAKDQIQRMFEARNRSVLLRFDKNGNGKLDPDETKMMVDSLSRAATAGIPKLSGDGPQYAAPEQYDINHNGKLEGDEKKAYDAMRATSEFAWQAEQERVKALQPKQASAASAGAVAAGAPALSAPKAPVVTVEAAQAAIKAQGGPAPSKGFEIKKKRPDDPATGK